MARVFLDFEASSLGRRGVPIEVGWVFEDDAGPGESHLIRPAPGWDDWSAEAEAIHGISRAQLLQDGQPHESVAARMVAVLSGHDLLASAPSWDGHWLSLLMREAGLPRHALRLRDTDGAQEEAVRQVLVAAGLPAGTVTEHLTAILGAGRDAARLQRPAHRALPDARSERDLFRGMMMRAEALLAERRACRTAEG